MHVAAIRLGVWPARCRSWSDDALGLAPLAPCKAKESTMPKSNKRPTALALLSLAGAASCLAAADANARAVRCTPIAAASIASSRVIAATPAP